MKSLLKKNKQTWLTIFSRYSFIFDLIFICLITLVIAVMATVWYSYKTNSDAILDLSEKLILQVNSTITQKTANYLVPAPVMAELGARIAGDQVDSLTNNKELNGLMIEVLKLYSQLSIFSIANTRGDFLMHLKKADGQIASKTIDFSKGSAVSTWLERDADGKVISQKIIPYDGFVATKRPWFIGASERQKSYWSDVYIFHTSQQPGITSSFPIIRNGKVIGVFGLDILLAELSDFVAAQKIGNSGETFLINAKGQIIAGENSKPVMDENNLPRLMTVAEHSNPALALAWNKTKNETDFRVVVTVNNKRWIATFLPLEGELSTHGWTVGFLVPEDEIIGALKKSNQLQLVISLTILLLAVFVGFGLKRMKNVLDTQSRFIRHTFGRYLSDEVVTEILSTPEAALMSGEKRVVTMMMTDLRGITALSERYPPEDVVKILNQFLGEMTEVIIKWGGTIDEFIGDAIFALFGAPLTAEDDVLRAIACALEMQLAMGKVNEINKEKGYPVLGMGAGINTGQVVVGNLGSVKRTKYGVVGKQVNLTSRIESYTVGGQVLISQSTLNECGDLLVLGIEMEVLPKGIAEPIKIYEVLGIKGNYNIMLPKIERAAMQSLQEAIDIVYTVLEGKHSGQSSKIAKLVSFASDMYIELQLYEGNLSVHEDIKIQFNTDSYKGDCYGKVMQNIVSQEKKILVALTSLPPELKQFLFSAVKINVH